MLILPGLIQDCKLTDNQLKYLCMGSTEFELGNQTKSLKRIFAIGINSDITNVSIDGKKIAIYMVAGKNFPFRDYQPYLQQLVDGRLNLQEMTEFIDVLKAKAGIRPCRYHFLANVWFDFENNDVFWTLNENNQEILISTLKNIKERWLKL